MRILSTIRSLSSPYVFFTGSLLSASFLSVALLASPSAAQSSLDSIPIEHLTKEQQIERRITPEVYVVRSASPAVAFIETDTQRIFSDFWGRTSSRLGNSSGSGVVMTSDGFVVTNYHVVKDAKQIRVSFEKSIDDGVYQAELLSHVAEEDLALLKIHNPNGKVFSTLPLGTSSDLMIGERVIAIGNPYGHTNTVSAGIISGLHRGVRIGDPNSNTGLEFNDLIQTDASINPGNSGGPLLNINGELIGINNAVNTQAENIGFAIPIDRIMDVLTQQLISPDRYSAWMGFEANESEGVDRIFVQGVLAGSPAADAGVRTGDRVLGFTDEPIKTVEEFRLARLAQRPGQLANMRVERAGNTLTLPIKPWDKSEGLLYERLGVRVELIAIRRQPTLRITEVTKGGAADQTKLEVGDLIAAMRTRSQGLTQAYTFSDRLQLAAFVDREKKGAELDIEIRRGDRLYQGTIVLH